MRIAQVAPLYESVPPKTYGGTERVVHYLTEELVSMGHEVTLFAAGDSVTTAQLIPGCERSLRLDPNAFDPLAYHTVMLDAVARQRERFDVIHFHVDYLHFLMSRLLRLPQLTTLHGRLDLPVLERLYTAFNDIGLVSISNAQREPLPKAKWLGTVLHGIPPEQFQVPSGSSRNYFAFLGRISPEKRVDRAVEIATSVGVPLKIAAKVDTLDEEYHRREIAPLLDYPGVEFIGEIGESEKAEFLGNARALLFPIDWPEPFGLVLIESMACGTPVIAFRRGSVPEVVEHGVSGFIVDDVNEAIAAARRIEELDRLEVRKAFERRFTSRRMAENYVRLYSCVVEQQERAA